MTIKEGKGKAVYKKKRKSLKNERSEKKRRQRWKRRAIELYPWGGARPEQNASSPKNTCATLLVSLSKWPPKRRGHNPKVFVPAVFRSRWNRNKPRCLIAARTTPRYTFCLHASVNFTAACVITYQPSYVYSFSTLSFSLSLIYSITLVPWFSFIIIVVVLVISLLFSLFFFFLSYKPFFNTVLQIIFHLLLHPSYRFSYFLIFFLLFRGSKMLNIPWILRNESRIKKKI